jgi:hypothetical protein
MMEEPRGWPGKTVVGLWLRAAWSIWVSHL